MEERFGRYHPDMEAMHRGFRTDSCFVCRMVDGDILFPENIVYEDERSSSSWTAIRERTATPWSPPRNTANRLLATSL